MGQVLGIAILVVLVLAGIPLWQRNKRKFKAHNDEMQAWAESHGCSFAAADNSQYGGYTFYPFGQTENQFAHRVVTGKYDEREIAVYDFCAAFGGGGPQGSNNDVYFAMLVMTLPAPVPWLHVTDRKHVNRHDKDNLVSTGDEAFDSVYALIAADADWARSAVSATVRAGLQAQSLSGMHIVDGRLVMWQTRHKHDVAKLEDRLRFAATVAADLPAAR